MSMSDPDALDKIIEASFENPTSRATPDKSDDLDQLIEKNVESAEAHQREYSDFEESRDVRNDLRDRFTRGDKKADLGEMVEAFLDWDKKLKADPLTAADELAGEYLRMPVSSRKASAAAKIEEQDGIDRALNAALAKRLDQEDFSKTAKAREMLKAAYPNLTFNEALRNIQKMHDELSDDPLGAAGRLAARYGVPVTQSQHKAVHTRSQQTHEMGFAEQIVARAAQTLPQFRALEPKIIEILNSPDFERTGDYSSDLSSAYQTAIKRVTDAAFAVEKAKAAQSPKSSGTAPGTARMSLDDMIRERLA